LSDVPLVDQYKVFFQLLGDSILLNVAISPNKVFNKTETSKTLLSGTVLCNYSPASINFSFLKNLFVKGGGVGCIQLKIATSKGMNTDVTLYKKESILDGTILTPSLILAE
jgi:hypothetical protein